jgi:hypothetical protein
MIVTPVATRASYSGSLTPSPAESAKLASQELILAARTMTGFAVIPDDTPFSRSTPAMHVSEFRRATESIGIERDFGKFVDLATKHVPFAFITAARMDVPGEQHLFIAPVQILSEPKNAALRVTLGQDIRLTFIHDVSAYQRLP